MPSLRCGTEGDENAPNAGARWAREDDGRSLGGNPAYFVRGSVWGDAVLERMTGWARSGIWGAAVQTGTCDRLGWDISQLTSWVRGYGKARFAYWRGSGWGVQERWAFVS